MVSAEKDCFGVTPKPARETRALPITQWNAKRGFKQRALHRVSPALKKDVRNVIVKRGQSMSMSMSKSKSKTEQ